MNPISADQPGRRIEELIQQMLDGSLTDSQHAELMQFLQAHAEAREVFVEQVRLHSLLREKSNANQTCALSSHLFGVSPEEVTELASRFADRGSLPSAAPLVPASPPAAPVDLPPSHPLLSSIRDIFFLGLGTASRSMAMAMVWLGTGLVSGLVIGVITAVFWFSEKRDVLPEYVDSRSVAGSVDEPRGNSPSISPVAYLTSVNGCNWDGRSIDSWQVGRSVRTGDEITLHEGIAEFRLASGVSLSIEGPAALVITSPTSLVLQHGRLTVYSPWSSGAFQLVAGSCRIVANEAEFGVRLAGGLLDIHAFSGDVLAMPSIQDLSFDIHDVASTPALEEEQTPGSEFRYTKIAPGRGLTLIHQDDVVTISEWHVAKESEFATKLSMAGPLPISTEYVKAVRDSRPFAYWRFEDAKGKAVANEIAGGPELTISDKVNFVRESGNGVVELGRPGLEGKLLCREGFQFPETADYSVEIWMKPSHFHYGGLVGMVVPTEDNSREGGAFCLLTTRASGNSANTRQRLRFMHRDPPGFDPKVGTDCYTTEPYRLRRWQHVVAVKRGPTMHIYLDGSLVGTKRDQTSLTKKLAVIVGGVGFTRRIYPFVGQLDELAIYGHALSADEIAEHINMIRWESPKSRSAEET
jgi:hypothetical protein